MKKLFCLLILISAIGVAQANIVNGDFESGATGWTQWWGGNSGVPVADPVEADNAAGIWWSDDGMFQGMAISPGTYTVSGDMLDQSDWPLLGGREGWIQVEIGDGTNIWWTQVIILDATSLEDVWYSGSTVIDNTTAGATYMNINLMLNDTLGPGGGGTVYYDNITVVPEPATMALLGLGALVLRRRK